jgi:PAS domain S-box-containing protein
LSVHDDEEEESLLRSVALQNVSTVLAARQRAEQELVKAKEQAERLATELKSAVQSAQLVADVAKALTGIEPLPNLLGACAKPIVEHLDAALARIWTLSQDGTTLELQASAGLYKHLDGPHGRVPIGALKIGLIAQERKPHLTNDVQRDPKVSDRAWAVREKLVAFAGYPLLVQDRLVGVVAMFSRSAVSDDVVEALASLADVVALGIERRRADAARIETELRKASILEASTDPIVAIDREGRIIDFNPAAERQFLYKREDVVGKEMAALIIPPAYRERHRQGIQQYLATGEGTIFGKRIEMSALRSDGSEFPVELSITPMAVGGTLAFTGYMRDITERKVAEDRQDFLTEATLALATILDVKKTLSSLAHMIVPKLADWCAIDMLREDGNGTERIAVAHVDPASIALAEDLAKRYPAAPDATYGVANVVRTGQSELYSHIADEQLAASASDAEHLRLLRELRLRSAMAVPLTARRHTLGAITFVLSDSTRRYAADDLLFVEELARRAAIAVDNARLYESEQRARRSADLASRAKDDFLATVSHELRTPLNVMLGWTRMLRRGDLSREKHDRALETIERNAVAQTQLIEDLLDVSRIISGKLRLDVQSVELSKIVEQAIDSLRLAAEAKGVGVATVFDGAAGFILGDPHRLEQVVWNLLSNAIKFTPKGGASI